MKKQYLLASSKSQEQIEAMIRFCDDVSKDRQPEFAAATAVGQILRAILDDEDPHGAWPDV